ncbi:hypothetical protein AVEN_198517-1 [Araneus ventricosus]|uniref:Uncharacterized protein n=1 Tax=Araneus ventricosus TaxID=182803 RepID=A0A4Y2J9L9_ARAVE|nr:hypothetical protein AVEN_198517-1 [Araneus ventricosus]
MKPFSDLSGHGYGGKRRRSVLYLVRAVLGYSDLQLLADDGGFTREVMKRKKGSLYNALSAQLTSLLARTAEETIMSFPMDQHTYRSASNSLLARTADRTRKTFALQGDPSRSTHPVIQALSLYSLPRQGVTSHGSSSTFKLIFSPNGNIEKIPAPLKSHNSSPNLSPRSGVQTWLLSVISYLLL